MSNFLRNVCEAEKADPEHKNTICISYDNLCELFKQHESDTKVKIMKCPQCSEVLVEPRETEKYCERCGYPEENRCEFTLIEIKSYLREMFQKQNCADDVQIENYRLACAYNLLTDDSLGIAKFCDDGKVVMSDINKFQDAPM